MATSLPFLELPVQLFVAGSASGMLYSTLRFRQTGDAGHYPVFVGYFALAGFGTGVLINLLRPLFSG